MPISWIVFLPWLLQPPILRWFLFVLLEHNRLHACLSLFIQKILNYFIILLICFSLEGLLCYFDYNSKSFSIIRKSFFEMKYAPQYRYSEDNVQRPAFIGLLLIYSYTKINCLMVLISTLLKRSYHTWPLDCIIFVTVGDNFPVLVGENFPVSCP